jgi:hypothetical protein
LELEKNLVLSTPKIVTRLSNVWIWDLGKTYSGSRGQKGTGSRHRNTALATIKVGTFANLDGMLGLQRAVGIEVGVRPGVGVHPEAVAHSSPAHGVHTQCGTTSQHAALLNNMLHTSQLTEGTLNITSR